jgi:hypothetical protein
MRCDNDLPGVAAECLEPLLRIREVPGYLPARRLTILIEVFKILICHPWQALGCYLTLDHKCFLSDPFQIVIH